MVKRKLSPNRFQFKESLRRTPISVEPDNEAPEQETVDNQPLTRMNTEPMGSPGTISYGGYVSEEYLGILRGKRRADVFDQMRRSDPQIKMCLSSVKNPIKSANWEIEPFDDSPEAVADADLIKHILFQDMDTDWEIGRRRVDTDWVDFIGEALTIYDFGHSVFEVINKVVLDDEKYGSYIGIKRLAFRSQRTIERWNLDPITGDLRTVTQYAYGDLDRTVDIPASDLIVLTLDKEGSNYEGISALRPCYGPWFRKNNYLKLNAVGIEKFAVPTPLIEIPEAKENSLQYTNMINAIQSYLTHQNGYLTYPEGWKVTLNSNTYDPAKVETSIDNEDKRMVKSFLANFLELGMGGAGSFAMSNNLSDFFLSGLDHVASKIESPMNKYLIPGLIKMNRGARANYPKLKHSGVSDKAGKELSEILKYLGDTQFIIPDELLSGFIIIKP
ncbi:MAG: hypothetical protein V4507_15220, partial [Verrucomicrobiota bacterium]